MSQTDPDNGEQASIGVFRTDTEMVVRVWDAALESMTGIRAATAIGKPVAEVIREFESRGLLARFEAVRTEGTTQVLSPALHKYLIPCPPRRATAYFTEMRQLVTISALRENEKISGVIVVVEDVTDRMSLERELASRLSDADDAVRLDAANALSKGSETMAREETEAIISALGDKNWRVRRKLVESISRRSAPETLSALLAAVREEHLDFGVLNSALQILQASSIDTTGTLIDFLKTGDADLRMQAALALGQHPNNAAAVAGLIDALGDDDANVRYHAIEALGKLEASDAVEPLLVIAETGDHFLSFAALEALKQIGDVAAAPRVLPLLKDHFLSEAAVGTLGATGGLETVDAIAELLNDGGISADAAATALVALHDRCAYDSDGEQIVERFRMKLRADGKSALLAALDSPGDASIAVAGWIDDREIREKLAWMAVNEHTRESAVNALAGQRDASVPYFVEMLDSDDQELRKAAVRSLGEIGSEPAVEALLRELRSKSEIASAAAQALGRSGSIAAFSGLIDVLATGDKVLQRSAVVALKSLSHPDKERRLLGLITDADPNVREAVIQIMGELGDEVSKAAILSSCTDTTESVRAAAIGQLGVFCPDEAIPVLAQALNDKSPRVRAAAVQTLGKFENGESIAALRLALGDEDAWTRYFAIRSLAQLNDVESRDKIGKLSESDDAEHVRAAAAEALAKL